MTALLSPHRRIRWLRLQETTGPLANPSFRTVRARAARHLRLVVTGPALAASGTTMSLRGGDAVTFLGLKIPAPGDIAAVRGPAHAVHAVHAVGGKLLPAAVAAHPLNSAPASVRWRARRHGFPRP